MKTTSLYLVGLVLFGFAAPVESSEVLTGRDLLKAVRQIQGRRSKPAYVNRPVKAFKVTSNTNTTATSKTSRKLLEPMASEHTKVRLASTATSKARRENISVSPKTSVHKRLAQSIDLSSLKKDTPLSEALEILRNSVEPPLEFAVFWSDLRENAYIGPDTPINMQFLGTMQLRNALELLLKYSPSRITDVGFVIEDGFIAIATKDFLRRNLPLNVTDTADIVGAPAGFSFEMDIGNTSRGSTKSSGR